MKDSNVRVMLEESEVDARIDDLGSQITKDYEGEEVHLICVLKGGAFFACELAKRIDLPLSIDFMCVSSYGNNTVSSGTVKIVKDLDESIEGKNVIIAEDIVDSGKTLSELVPMLMKRNPKSIEICTLLSKPERREYDINVKYTGFTIPDEFVVGYGLDYAQKYRNLPYIGVVESDD
ncbi:MAG: hypoxanthine phosphoribosyltransferase [Lachnospiraceae bacterium]|nr:hypoxanthine phosphoribosyltransferase [Lachnospiraceae bacterium]